MGLAGNESVQEVGRRWVREAPEAELQAALEARRQALTESSRYPTIEEFDAAFSSGTVNTGAKRAEARTEDGTVSEAEFLAAFEKATV